MKRRTFVVANKQLAALPNWFSVTEVMKQTDNAPFLRAAGVTSYEDPKFARYNERLTRLRGIRDYVYRLDVLEDSLSYKEVTDIFVRANSLGAKLRGSDLALAQITARWRGSLESVQRFQEQCDRNGFELDLGFHVRALVAILTSQSRFRTVGSISQTDLLSGWDRTTVAVERAINVMKANVGIQSPVLLSPRWHWSSVPTGSIGAAALWMMAKRANCIVGCWSPMRRGTGLEARARRCSIRTLRRFAMGEVPDSSWIGSPSRSVTSM